MEMKHRYLKSVTTLNFDTGRCVSCGICETVCPHGVFEIYERKTQLADKDACIECGACALNCPTKALSVNPGVGCALAFIKGWLKGTVPNCDCGIDNQNCC